MTSDAGEETNTKWHIASLLAWKHGITVVGSGLCKCTPLTTLNTDFRTVCTNTELLNKENSYICNEGTLQVNYLLGLTVFLIRPCFIRAQQM